jgi:glycosyltransferase involved in cell wall biosynthesis
MEYEIMEKYPFVSVLLPIYNGEKYITNAITTVINQIDQDYELIVSIDASSDSSERIARKFEESNERIRVYTHVNRLGMRGNYDFLIGKANGSWLTILGQDDAMMPFAISELRRSILKAPHMTSLVSRRAYAFWPDTKGEFGRSKFIYPISPNKVVEVLSKQFLADCLKGKSDYLQGPQLYTGSFISRETIRRILSRQDGILFPYPIPDVSSSASILSVTEIFHYSKLPLFIIGTSGSSTGLLIEKEIGRSQDTTSIASIYADAFKGETQNFNTPGHGVFTSFSWYLFEATMKVFSVEQLLELNFDSGWALASLKANNTRKRRHQKNFRNTFQVLQRQYDVSRISLDIKFIILKLLRLKTFLIKYVGALFLMVTGRLVLEKFDDNFNLLVLVEKVTNKLSRHN